MNRSLLIERSDDGGVLASVFVHGREEPRRYVVPLADLPKWVADQFRTLVTRNDIEDKLDAQHND